MERQFEIVKKVKIRIGKRKKLIDRYEAGHTHYSNMAPGLQATVEQCKAVTLIVLHFCDKID